MANFSDSSASRAYEDDIIAVADKFIGAQPHRLFVGGRWQDASSGESFEVMDPATGKRIARCAAATHGDLDAAVAAASQAFPAWRAMDPHERGALLNRIAGLMEAHAEELAVIQSRDLGSNPALSRALVAGGIEAFRYYAGWTDKIFGRTMPSDTTSLTYTVREPLGVVAAIIPWNGPAQASSWKMAAALACGNTVLLKAASEAPLVCVRIFELLAAAGLAPGVANLLTGSGEVIGQAMAEHAGIAKVTFTGSTAVGRQILVASAATLKKVTLELGGKSATVIFADADLKAAIAAATTAFVSGAGQSCVCGARIVVEASICEEVVKGVADLVKGMKLGSAFEEGVEIAPMVSGRQLDRVLSYVERGQEEGARLVMGGTRRDGIGFYMLPTVFADVNGSMVIAQEEIFGPVVAIIPFRDEDEALEIANGTQYGLAASVWTRDAGRLHRFMARLQAGTVWGNTILELDTKAPFGGYKESGLGRELGPDSIEAFTQVKTGVIRFGEK